MDELFHGNCKLTTSTSREEGNGKTREAMGPVGASGGLCRFPKLAGALERLARGTISKIVPGMEEGRVAPGMRVGRRSGGGRDG
jgi:hypothetical protein